MTSDSLTLRAARPEDVPTLLGFIRDLARFERLEHEVVATEEGLRESLFGPRPGAEVVFAEVEGRAVGFMLFFATYSTFLGRIGLYLEDLYVDPSYRGRGIGGVLLASLARIARERGAGRLEWAVLDWNADAIRFYERLGARPQGEWTTYRLTGDALSAVADDSMAREVGFPGRNGGGGA